MIELKKGLDLPITGAPSQKIDDSKKITKVAITGFDYVGMKPSMLVKEGDQVKTGQPLFSCKKNIGLVFTSPGTGTVKAINRGEKRVFQSLEIELSSQEEQVEFKAYQAKDPADYSADEIKALLIESGSWASLRQRPFEKVADVNGKPSAIFINAMDTNPLAPEPYVFINENYELFETGVKVLSKLTEGQTFVCQDKMAPIAMMDGVHTELFGGPHPAGNVGTHIHFLHPVDAERYVWHAGYQDVIAIGALFKTGKLFLDRLISVAGPFANDPKYVRTRKGAHLSEITAGEAKAGSRVISGSVFNGRKQESAFNYLGHYHNQISLIEEDNKRELLGWHKPGFDQFSVKNIYVSKLMPKKLFNFGSNTNGSLRAMVPIGSFEKVMPLDILPTQLLRLLVAKDTDGAQELGALELAEEDISLLTFVAPGKVDFGPLLRENLTTIEKEG
jgi:Na+-transporting NADH:ubiquinone oxidoreductase subunit A